MSESKEAELAKQFEEEFFTPEFFEMDALVQRLLKCANVEDYRKIRGETKPTVFSALHAAAAFNDPEAKRFTEAELWNIFEALPTLTSSEAEFI